MTDKERRRSIIFLSTFPIRIKQEQKYVDCAIEALKAFEERPHGEWIEVKNRNGTVIAYTCSNCGSGAWKAHITKYCGNCGSNNRERKEKALENLASAKTVTDPSRRVEMVCDLIRKKEDLLMENDERANDRDCETCIHKKEVKRDIFACEVWECKYEPKSKED